MKEIIVNLHSHYYMWSQKFADNLLRVILMPKSSTVSSPDQIQRSSILDSVEAPRGGDRASNDRRDA